MLSKQSVAHIAHLQGSVPDYATLMYKQLAGTNHISVHYPLRICALPVYKRNVLLPRKQGRYCTHLVSTGKQQPRTWSNRVRTIIDQSKPPVDLSAQLVLANEVFRFSCATRVLPLKTVKFCCQLSWKENLEMSNEWSHGLFSCFEDCSTCELMRSSRQTDLATDFFSFFFFFLFFSRRHPYMVLSMLCVR